MIVRQGKQVKAHVFQCVHRFRWRKRITLPRCCFVGLPLFGEFNALDCRRSDDCTAVGRFDEPLALRWNGVETRHYAMRSGAPPVTGCRYWTVTAWPAVSAEGL